jgi:hypothetical protein
VLTKPDRIPTGEEPNWLPFIRNEKETLENNWYCVKQPSSSDMKLGITWAQARRREEEFFAMTPPWSEIFEDLQSCGEIKRPFIGLDCKKVCLIYFFLPYFFIVFL